MNFDCQIHRNDSDALSLAWYVVPWDTDIFGFRVVAISEFKLLKQGIARSEFASFINWLHVEKIAMASVRMPSTCLEESLFLEDFGFRFIETVLHPYMSPLQGADFPEQGLIVELATDGDLPAIESIAKQSFSYERFHADPRFENALADKRYRIWVRNGHACHEQSLYKILEGDQLIGFFITENKENGLCYWHLSAIHPEFQGRGYGKRAWKAMLHFQQRQGIKEILTTISARNTPVLNLYVGLDFCFKPSEITLHWLKNS